MSDIADIYRVILEEDHGDNNIELGNMPAQRVERGTEANPPSPRVDEHSGLIDSPQKCITRRRLNIALCALGNAVFLFAMSYYSYHAFSDQNYGLLSVVLLLFGCMVPFNFMMQQNINES